MSDADEDAGYPIDVYLRDTTTGVTGVHRSEGCPHPDDPTVPFNAFVWSEGNFACDCNRGDFLYGPDDDRPCGEGRYVIDKIVRVDTGETIYTEAA